MSTFLRGSILLMIAIFLSKFLGFIYRMQFVRLTGEEVVGIYMTAYPAFIFFLSILQLGLPIAISKIVAELRTKNAVADYFSVMRTSIILTVISIIIFTPLFLFVTPFISENLLKNDAITMTLCFHCNRTNCSRRWLTKRLLPRYCSNRRNSCIAINGTNRTNIAD